MDKIKLQKVLKDLAMKTTQDEYMAFILKPLIEANGEKSRIQIENLKKEHPEIIERIKKGNQKVYDAWEKNRKQYEIWLKNRVVELKEEYESLKDKTLLVPKFSKEIKE